MMAMRSARSHTKQVESKADHQTYEPEKEGHFKPTIKKHLRTNSYIGSNRMSPTPQPIPIEIFTQTDSNMSSSQRDSNLLKKGRAGHAKAGAQKGKAREQRAMIILASDGECNASEGSDPALNCNLAEDLEIHDHMKSLSSVMQQLNHQTAYNQKQNSVFNKSQAFVHPSLPVGQNEDQLAPNMLP